MAASLIVSMGVGALFDRLTQTPDSKPTMGVGGKVYCPPGEEVVGVWLQPSDGKGDFIGFVPARSLIASSNSAQFSAGLPQGTKTFRIDVGCGGSPNLWENNDQTPTLDAVDGNLITVACEDGTDKENRNANGTILGGSCAVQALIPLP